MHDETKPRGTLAIQTVAMPCDTNANGDIFGGWLVSRMDLAAGVEARLRARSRTVTVAIDAMRFIKPVGVGDIVCCYVDLTAVGRTSMKFNVEVWTISIEREKPLKVAEGIFSFVAIDNSGKPHPVDR